MTEAGVRQAARSVVGTTVCAGLAVCALGFVLATGVQAQSSAPAGAEATVQAEVLSPEAKAVADRAVGRVRSPFCPGLMLEVCPTPDAADLRDTIRAWASTGVSTDSIVSLVVAQYGEEYRGFPQTEGRGWLAWLVPPAVLLLGICAVMVALKHLKRSGEERTVPVTEADAEEVREALRALEEAEGSVF